MRVSKHGAPILRDALRALLRMRAEHMSLALLATLLVLLLPRPPPPTTKRSPSSTASARSRSRSASARAATTISMRGWSSRHIGKHIPGNPTVIVQNMPGAGSRRLANTLANVGPHDGTMIGLPNQGIAMDQALGTEGVKFDARKFNWIGSPVEDNNVFWGWHTNPVKTIEDARSAGIRRRRHRPGLADDLLSADHERAARHQVQGRRPAIPARTSSISPSRKARSAAAS